MYKQSRQLAKVKIDRILKISNSTTYFTASRRSGTFPTSHLY